MITTEAFIGHVSIVVLDDQRAEEMELRKRAASLEPIVGTDAELLARARAEILDLFPRCNVVDKDGDNYERYIQARAARYRHRRDHPQAEPRRGGALPKPR